MTEVLNKLTEAKPDELLKGVRKSVDEFVMGAEQFDDITMLCIDYRGKK